MPANAEARRLELNQLRRLEVVSLVEATTLVLLVAAAVLLKHLAHLGLAVMIMGPSTASRSWLISGRRCRRRPAAGGGPLPLRGFFSLRSSRSPASPTWLSSAPMSSRHRDGYETVHLSAIDRTNGGMRRATVAIEMIDEGATATPNWWMRSSIAS